MRAMFLSSDPSLRMVTDLLPSVSSNVAVVLRSTPMVAPMPHGMALMTVIDPWDLPSPFMQAPSS